MIPPRWVFRTFWAIHKGVDALSGGRLGTRAPAARRVGTLFLLTRGRRSGTIRRNGVYYLEDGDDLVVVASNAGAVEDPSWWLNLKANAEAEVDLPGGRRPVRARLATAQERARLWPALVAANPPYADYERATTRVIPVVILEPR